MGRETVLDTEHPVTMDRLVQLLSTPDTAVLAARHAARINILCSTNASGFCIADLDGVCSILELTIETIKAGNLQFVECMCLMLRVLERPFKKKLCTDGIKMSASICRTLALVSACLYKGAPAEVQLAACQTLIAFTRGDADLLQHVRASDSVHSGAAECRQQQLENQRLICESNISAAIVEALHCTTMERLAMAYLDVLMHISCFEPTAQQLCEQTHLLAHLPEVANVFSITMGSPLLPLLLDVLWNILEAMPKPRMLPAQTVISTTHKEHLESHADTFTEVDEGSAAAQYVHPLTRLCNSLRLFLHCILHCRQTSLEIFERLVSCPSDFTPPEFHSAVSRQLSNQSVRQSIKESAERARSTFKRRNDSIAVLGASDSLQPIHEKEPSHSNRLPGGAHKTLNAAYAGMFERLLREAYMSCYDERSKQSRNTALALLLFLVENGDFCWDVNSSGLTKLLGTVVCANELESPMSSGITPCSMQSDDVCHEQIRLLWHILACMCEQCVDSRTEILRSGFMDVILCYIKLNSQDLLRSQRWNPPQLGALQRQAVGVLFRLSVLSPDDFQKRGGAEVLLAFITHGKDSYQIECAVRVLRHLAQQCKSTRTWLGEHGAIAVVKDRFQDRSMSEDMRKEAIMALHALCTGNMHSLSVCEDADIVRLCVVALKDLCGTDPTLPNVLVIQTFAMLWTLILQSERCLECLLSQGGVEVIMSHMEHGHPSLQPLTMSILADMLDMNRAARARLLNWKSERTAWNAVRLLLHLWREAESEWQVCTNGILTSVHKPLAGTGKRNLWIPRHEIVYGCLSQKRKHEIRAVSNAVDIDARMRKIYSVLHLIGFNAIHSLDATDQATLTLVEKYVKFKQGEIWMHIASKFHTSGFRPTAADRARLTSGIDFSEHLSTIVMKDQTRLLQSEQEAMARTEMKQYQDRLDQAKLEYDSQFYKRDRSKVSAKEKSQARKLRDTMIEVSRAKTSKNLASATTASDEGEAALH